MKDRNLENFIRARREEFDDDRPSLKVWANIERGLLENHKSAMAKKWVWRSLAASLLLMVGVGLGLIIYPKLQEQQALQAINMTTDLDEMETFFTQQIDAKLAAAITVGIDQESKLSLTETESEIQKLKLDLIYAPRSSREEIMQAIIATYESKIYILETILERVSPSNDLNNETTIL